MSASDADDGLFDLQAEEERLLRELAEWLPRRGDKLLQATPSAAHIDPFGSPARQPADRSPVGRWGLYSDGFLMAADRLVDSLRGVPAEDALIYPVFYLYRHHLELELKALILYCLNWLSGLNEAEVKEVLEKKCFFSNHNLHSLWSLLKSSLEKHHSGYRANTETEKAFERLLSELHTTDRDSQAARYAMDKQGGQTFLGLQYVDLQVLKAGIHKMAHYLRSIKEGIGEEIDWRGEQASW